jgi:AsmA protein
MANDIAASGITASPGTSAAAETNAPVTNAPAAAPVPAGLPLPASAPIDAPPAPAPGAPMNLRVTIEAEKATMSGLTLDAVSAQAIASDELVSLSPITFNVFGGRYEGSLSVTLRTAAPTFRWIANLSNIDVARATAYAGSPDTASGTLSGKIDLTGSGTDAAAAMKTARGIVRLDVADGVVRNLGLVRSVGAATSLTLEGLQRAAMNAASNTDEPFQRLGGTIAVGSGVATTQDLQFDATDLSMTAQGIVQLDGSAMNLKAQLRLSEALSREVNSKMLRLSQQGGRVTLPATITGTFAAPSVKIDSGTITRRAITNTATEAAPNLIKRGIGGLIRR